MSKRVLVTGGAGFLGINLCQKLVREGHDVICVDNFYSSRKGRGFEDLLAYRNFEFIRHDVGFPLYLEVDEVYNLACPASPIHYQRDPVQTVKTCVMGMIHVLGLAKRTGAKVLQASTSEVYGDPKVHPQTESYWGNVNPAGIRSCYDEGKRVAETLCFDYFRQHGVDARVVRIFNTYGPHMHPNDGRVVSNFVVQALKGDPVTIYGEGEQTRSFCYVSDLIEGFTRVMALPENPGRPINLGNPGEFTIAQLAELVFDLTGAEKRIAYRELPTDDPVRRRPDITLAKNLLDWEPKVSLEEGLRPTIDYFRSLLWYNGEI